MNAITFGIFLEAFLTSNLSKDLTFWDLRVDSLNLGCQVSRRGYHQKVCCELLFLDFFYLGKLVLSNSNLFEDDIAIDLERLYSLKFLDLSYNNFRNLPYCISHLPKLKVLTLNHYMSLESISGLPVNEVSLLALGCSSMERPSILPG
jgi:Leucine-rich repeat (LRR) protein